MNLILPNTRKKSTQLGATIQAIFTVVCSMDEYLLSISKPSSQGKLGSSPAGVEHEVGQVVAAPRRYSLLADGPRRCPLGCILVRSCPQQAHTAAAKKDDQAAAACTAAQGSPGPAGENNHFTSELVSQRQGCLMEVRPEFTALGCQLCMPVEVPVAGLTYGKAVLIKCIGRVALATRAAS